jgi:hypothetical protein
MRLIIAVQFAGPRSSLELLKKILRALLSRYYLQAPLKYPLLALNMLSLSPLPLTFDMSSAKLCSNFLSDRLYWEESFMLLSDTLKQRKKVAGGWD